MDEAYAAYNDAETEMAIGLLRKAHEALECQTKPVEQSALISLYHLDALTALSAEDQKGAVYAMIRAISVDPTALPPQSMGPEIAEMHSTWSARLQTATLSLSIADDASPLWIDGQLLGPGESRKLVEGEHLFQREDDGAFRTVVVDVSAKISESSPWFVRIESAAPKPVMESQPVVAPEKKAPKKKKNPKKAVRLGVTLSGVAVAVAGGGLLGWGATEEAKFSNATYPLENFSNENQRVSTIEADARRINQLYMLGYGLIGVGVATTSVGVFVMPVSGGTGVGLQGRW